MALSPTIAAPPKPVVDLSRSPALSDQQAPPATPAKKPSNGLDQQTMELGGGALVILALGGVALAMSRRKRRREEESWQFAEPTEPAEPVAQAEPEPEALILTEPVASEQPAIVAPPMSFEEPRRATAGSDCDELETWTERAKCGPTPDNPSQSLKKRMKRAAFFEKRDREVAAGEAKPVDPDAGLPENLEETA